MAPESLYQGLYTTKSDVYVQKIPTLLNTFRYIAAEKTSATLKIVISEWGNRLIPDQLYLWQAMPVGFFCFELGFMSEIINKW